MSASPYYCAASLGLAGAIERSKSAAAESGSRTPISFGKPHRPNAESRHTMSDTPRFQPQARTPPRQPACSAPAVRDRRAESRARPALARFPQVSSEFISTPTRYRLIISATSPTPGFAITGLPQPSTSAIRVGERPSSDVSPPAYSITLTVSCRRISGISSGVAE